MAAPSSASGSIAVTKEFYIDCKAPGGGGGGGGGGDSNNNGLYYIPAIFTKDLKDSKSSIISLGGRRISQRSDGYSITRRTNTGKPSRSAAGDSYAGYGGGRSRKGDVGMTCVICTTALDYCVAGLEDGCVAFWNLAVRNMRYVRTAPRRGPAPTPGRRAPRRRLIPARCCGRCAPASRGRHTHTGRAARSRRATRAS